GWEGGGGVGRDGDVDARLGHFLRDDGFERRLVDRMRDCRRRNGRLAANVEPSVSAAVAELNRCLRSGAVNFVNQACEAGQKAIVVEPNLATAMASDPFWRRHPGG